MHKLSIITCTYNSEKYIKKCLESLNHQKLDQDLYEHIIIDGFSTDNTINILNNYKNTHKHINVLIIQKKPKGVYNALNEGIKLAQGEYIFFLNSDDFVEKNVLSEYLSYAQNKKCDVYYGNINFVYPNNQKKATNIGKRLSLRKILARMGFHCLILFPSVLIKRQIFNATGLFDENKKISSDFGLWLMFFKNRASLQFFPAIISNFRVHKDSLSSGKYPDLGINEMKDLRKEILGVRGVLVNNASMLIQLITGMYF